MKFTAEKMDFSALRQVFKDVAAGKVDLLNKLLAADMAMPAASRISYRVGNLTLMACAISAGNLEAVDILLENGWFDHKKTLPSCHWRDIAYYINEHAGDVSRADVAQKLIDVGLTQWPEYINEIPGSISNIFDPYKRPLFKLNFQGCENALIHLIDRVCETPEKFFSTPAEAGLQVFCNQMLVVCADASLCRATEHLMPLATPNAVNRLKSFLMHKAASDIVGLSPEPFSRSVPEFTTLNELPYFPILKLTGLDAALDRQIDERNIRLIGAEQARENRLSGPFPH